MVAKVGDVAPGPLVFIIYLSLFMLDLIIKVILKKHSV